MLDIKKNQLQPAVFKHLYIFFYLFNLIPGSSSNITPRKVYTKSISEKKICRLCAEAAERYGRLFGKASEKKRICEKVFLVTGVKLLETDERNDVICQKCERQLEKSVEFNSREI